MKIKDILRDSKKAFPSLEIVPPRGGISKKELLETIRPLMEFRPPYINVTSHREEYEFRQTPDGSFTRHAVMRRVSETAVCCAIQAEFGVEPVPHLICGGRSADRIESTLQDFRFMGFENVMTLRGDSLIGEKRFTPEPDGYRYASELVAAVRRFEKDKDCSFCIGVGAYPEKHFEAANLDQDIANLKRKVAAGADYIITQMFFDNSVFYRFRDKCREAGITVPIIPGLKPLSNARQIELLPRSFSIDIPQELVHTIHSHADDAAYCYEAGREWCSAQCKDLLKHGVPAIHFYTMGRQDNVTSILRDNF